MPINLQQLKNDPKATLGTKKLLIAASAAQGGYNRQVVSYSVMGGRAATTESIELFTHVSNASKLGMSLTEDGNTCKLSIGGGGFEAYYLPWATGKAYLFTLGHEAEVFATAQLNGCCVLVGGPAATPVVIHANCGNSTRVEDFPAIKPNANPSEVAAYGAALAQHQADQYSVLYANLAGTLIQQGVLDSNHPISLFDPSFYLSAAYSKASVFGVWKGAGWKFYYNLQGASGKTGELWPTREAPN